MTITNLKVGLSDEFI